MFHSIKIGLMLLVFAIVISLACSAQSESEIKKTCGVSFLTFEGLPTKVLAGTDIVDISSFEVASPVLKKKGGGKSALNSCQIANEPGAELISYCLI